MSKFERTSQKLLKHVFFIFFFYDNHDTIKVYIIRTLVRETSKTLHILGVTSIQIKKGLCLLEKSLDHSLKIIIRNQSKDPRARELIDRYKELLKN